MRLTAEQVLAGRMRRQFLVDRDGTDPVAIARRLVGVQAQVPASAAQSVAIRTAGGTADDGTDDAALAGGTLLRTWAVRGTLHLLAADQAPAVLALVASLRSWEKGAWQKEFATAAQMAALADAAKAILPGAVLSRDELVAAFVAHADDPSLAETLASGWAMLLKPLAWQGLLCHGPASGGRVTFTSPGTAVPGWPGLPDPDAAAHEVVPAYLGAYGPASPATFDAWLLRGTTPKKRLKGWFAALVDDGTLTVVDVDGEPLHARTEDLDDLARTAPAPPRLLGGFDPYVLGPGTTDPRTVPPAHRGEVSRPGGWITPVVLDAGRVAGTWSVEDDRLTVTGFDDTPSIPEDERAAWSRVLGRALR